MFWKFTLLKPTRKCKERNRKEAIRIIATFDFMWKKRKKVGWDVVEDGTEKKENKRPEENEQKKNKKAEISYPISTLKPSFCPIQPRKRRKEEKRRKKKKKKSSDSAPI